MYNSYRCFGFDRLNESHLFIDKKILTKLAQAFDSQAEAFRSLSDSLNRMSENRFYQYNLMEDHFQSAPWNG